MSIRQMIDHTCRCHGADRSRVYLAGLSAGGAMTQALLAIYPQFFAGVAIFAGMAYGSARDAVSAVRQMKSGNSRSPVELGDAVRAVSQITGPGRALGWKEQAPSVALRFRWLCAWPADKGLAERGEPRS